MTTQRISAPATHTGHYSGGFPTRQPGPRTPQAHTRVHPFQPGVHRATFDDILTKVAAAIPGVATAIYAPSVGGPTRWSTVSATQIVHRSEAAPQRDHSGGHRQGQQPPTPAPEQSAGT